MSYENADADAVFQRIKNSLQMVENEDELDGENLDEDFDITDVMAKINEAIQETGGANDKVEKSEKTASPKESPKELTETSTTTTVQPQPVKKVYQFTEVSDGKKRDHMRFSQSKQFTAIQDVKTHDPILRTQDISPYKPSTELLDEIFKRIQKHNQLQLMRLSANQVANS
jgi:hypothetical protein